MIYLYFCEGARRHTHFNPYRRTGLFNTNIFYSLSPYRRLLLNLLLKVKMKNRA